MARWLLTGATGMLGHDADQALAAAGHQVTALSHRDLDVTDPDAVDAVVAGHDWVWNCAAWTAVDAAEAAPEAALAVNGTGPRLLAEAAARAGARMVQISTDYVFDGTGQRPYPEAEPASPVSVYGRTKAAGEGAVRSALPGRHLVVRTAWLYGAHGSCFPKTIAAVAAERAAARRSLDVVANQSGQPTWTRDVADLVLRLVAADAPAGTFHATATGQTTWFGLARAVVVAAGIDPGVLRPVTADRLPRPAPRPAYSVLGHDALHRLGVPPIGPWLQRWRTAAGEVLG